MIFALCTMLAGATEPAAPSDPVIQGLLAREQELLEIIDATDPQDHQRLLALRDTDRPSYLAALYRASKLSDRAQSDPAFAERVRRIAEREQTLRGLAEGFAARPPAEQVAVRAQMLALSNELLDLKQAERRLRLEELRARLEALEREIERREAEQDALARQYVERLLR